MKGKFITNKVAAICKIFHKCFLGMEGKIQAEPKSRWSFQIKPQVLRVSRASGNLLCCLFLIGEKSAYIGIRQWGVGILGWSFSLSAQLPTLKSLVKLKMQQSPKQWSAKVQFELAAVHAAVMKQEGEKKDGIKGRVNSALDIFNTEEILQREKGRKMNILIFITHTCSTISKARVWKQVSVCALVLCVILVLSEVFKFRQIHLARQ